MALRDELEDAGYRVLNLTDRHAEAITVARETPPDLEVFDTDDEGLISNSSDDDRYFGQQHPKTGQFP